MKKRILSLLLALAVMLTLLPRLSLPAGAAESSGTFGDNLKWSFDEKTGTLTISGKGPIPDYLTQEDYDEELDRAFQSWAEAREYYYQVGEEVPEDFGEFKFDIYDVLSNRPWETRNVVRVVLSEGITAVGRLAFSDCAALTDITFSKSVTGIGCAAFYSCAALTEVSIPDSVKTIDGEAFKACSALQKVSIGSGVNEIESAVFEGCRNLTELIVSKRNKSYSSDGFALMNKKQTHLMMVPQSVSGSYTVPDSIEKIDTHAFQNCDQMTSVTLGDSVTSVDAWAFSGCVALETVYFGKRVLTIYNVSEYCAFLGCKSMKAVLVDPANPYYSSDGTVLMSKDRSALYLVPQGLEGSYTVPSGITVIDEGAFFACAHLTSVTIPACVTAINFDAFDYCQLTDIYFGGTKEAWDQFKLNLGKTTIHFGKFSDVPDGAFYAGPVTWAINSNITKGVDAAHFGPNQACTRGQVVTFLWRTAGCPEPGSIKTPFTDVGPNAFYAKAVAWAVEKGITKGMSATTFVPNATCTRGQIVTFLWRFKNSPEPKRAKTGFIDVSNGAFYADAVAWAVENEVTNGMTKTTFAPNATCTRGQIVTFLYRAALRK